MSIFIEMYCINFKFYCILRRSYSLQFKKQSEKLKHYEVNSVNSICEERPRNSWYMQGVKNKSLVYERFVPSGAESLILIINQFFFNYLLSPA